jgi:hypothetical protein
MLRTPSPRELTKESLHPGINQATNTTQGNAENTFTKRINQGKSLPRN